MSEELVAVTVDIVSAYVSNNSLRAEELTTLLKDVYDRLQQTTAPAAQPSEPDKPQPAVPVKKSVQRDYLISLEDGKHYKTLKRHLAGLGMTPDEYRAKWSLPKDYPMTCAAYSEKRSALATAAGLGKLRKADVEDEVEAAIEEEVLVAGAEIVDAEDAHSEGDAGTGGLSGKATHKTAEPDEAGTDPATDVRKATRPVRAHPKPKDTPKAIKSA